MLRLRPELGYRHPARSTLLVSLDGRERDQQRGAIACRARAFRSASVMHYDVSGKLAKKERIDRSTNRKRNRHPTGGSANHELRGGNGQPLAVGATVPDEHSRGFGVSALDDPIHAVTALRTSAEPNAIAFL